MQNTKHYFDYEMTLVDIKPLEGRWPSMKTYQNLSDHCQNSYAKK